MKSVIQEIWVLHLYMLFQYHFVCFLFLFFFLTWSFYQLRINLCCYNHRDNPTEVHSMVSDVALKREVFTLVKNCVHVQEEERSGEKECKLYSFWSGKRAYNMGELL